MKRTRTPDSRPSWRDPDMPVIRDYLMGDGTRKRVVDQDYEHRYREMLMGLPPEPGRPLWHQDPTYNMRRPK